MIETTLSHMRRSSEFFKTTEILHIINGRKKEEIGFFVPISLKEEFQSFIETVEKKKKRSVLERVAKAQTLDPIGDGSLNDGFA